MNLEKFTDRAKGFLQAAQTIAIRMNHQRISPEHVAKALLEDNQGMAAGLIAKSGGDAARAVQGIDALLAKVPAVSGSGAQATPGLDNDAVRLLDQAEQVATKAGDGFVTVERLRLAMVLASGTSVAKAFADAEGRLVLADANEYVADKYKPRAIVNIATLTGSIVGALDNQYAGLFARDETLAAQLLTAGSASGEELWRMPLHENYAKKIESDIADVRNIAPGGGPGASIGAHFIGYFVAEATPWAHLDIAGVNQADSALPLVPKGMSGFGVRLLDQLARSGQ